MSGLKRLFSFIVLALALNFNLLANNPITFSSVNELLSIGGQVYLLEDKTNQLTIDDVITSKEFVKSEQEVPNLGVTNSSIWVKIEIKNNTSQENLVIAVNNPLINELELYSEVNNKYILKFFFKEFHLFSTRTYDDPNYLFDITIPQNNVRTYYLKVDSWENIQLPIQLGTVKAVLEVSKTKDFIVGIYTGIMLVMMFYNLFIFFSVKDKSYLYYVIYIFFIGLTQLTIEGYLFKFMWFNMPKFVDHSLIIFPSLAGVFLLQFVKIFMKTKIYTPYLHKGLFFVGLIYGVAILVNLLGYNRLSFKLIDINATLLSLLVLITAIIISIKGYRPAKYILLAWSVLLIGIIVYVLRNVGLLPSSDFTNYTMYIGTALETLLLSFALADRINILKKEKLEVLEANQLLIINQNITLEKKVKERTLEIEKQKKTIEEQRMKEVNSLRYKALTAQMNPHFIFNSLNSIRNFVLNNEPMKADGFLTKFAKLMRSMLDNSREDFCLLSDEVEALTNYLDLEKLRFEDKFDYAIKVDSAIDLEEDSIPSFLIQPYVENAVLHGVASKVGGFIHIEFKLGERGLYCIVEDNGLGRDEISSSVKPYKSVGMSITKERLSIIGLNSSVEIIDLKDATGHPIGTKVLVYVDNK